EDGIRDRTVTGVQTCALPILPKKVAGWLRAKSLKLRNRSSTLRSCSAEAARSSRFAASWMYPAACGSSLSSSPAAPCTARATLRSEEHTSELQSPYDLVCRLL